MSLLDLIKGLPWYAQLFVFGGLTGGWWHFVDTIHDGISSRIRPRGPGKDVTR